MKTGYVTRRSRPSYLGATYPSGGLTRVPAMTKRPRW